MPLLSQIVQLLTESPYNLVYHLITLLAVQIVLGIALGQWGRNRRDEVAQRMVLGAAAILIVRLFLAGAIAFVSGRNLEPFRYLPPLEQAVNTLTLIGLIWAVAPSWRPIPRLVDLIAFLLILVTAIVGIAFTLDWAGRTTTQVYNSDFQATVWGVTQIGLLVLGCGLVVVGRGRDWLLRLFVLLPLLAAHLIHQWNYPEFFVTDTELPYLIRLGHLMAFPLLMIVAYRHVLSELATSVVVTRPQTPSSLTDLLQLATQVIETPDRQLTQKEALAMVSHLLNPALTALALLPPDENEQIPLMLLRPRLENDQYHHISLKLSEWPSFAIALRQNESTELVPNGMGHQQIQRLYQQAGLELETIGPLLLEPLSARNRPQGLLIVAGKAGLPRWNPAERELVRHLAYFITHALQHAAAIEPVLPVPAPLNADERLALEKERDEALDQRQRWQVEAEKAQSRLLDVEQKQGHVTELERELLSLRQALAEAEEAMAFAAAGSSNLSPEWISRTVTRYSGELEEAQSRIEALETSLRQKVDEPDNDLLIGLIQELRTPMTSIAGYTDLLLSETMGILGSSQRDFLQRIRANAERTNTMMAQLLRVVTEGQAALRLESADVLSIVETAIDAIAPQLREKRLRLDMYLEDKLGQWQFNRDALYQIMIHLLSNACQASPSDSLLYLKGQMELVRETADGVTNETQLLHLAITDSGEGIASDDLAQVFEPHVETEAPLIAGLGDTGIGLAVTQQIVTTHHGRIWVEGKPGVGSTFSVLLPLTAIPVDHLKPSVNGSGKSVNS